MTTEEKFNAIIERIKAEKLDISPEAISMMLIIDYTNKLEQMKLIECGFHMTSIGQNVVAICEEFDWQPQDIDIVNFVNEMIEEPDRIAFIYMIKRFRDDRNGLIEEVSRFKSESP